MQQLNRSMTFIQSRFNKPVYLILIIIMNITIIFSSPEHSAEVVFYGSFNVWFPSI